MLKKFRPRARWGYVVMAVLTTISQLVWLSGERVDARRCPDLKIVFVRGSGAERNNNSDYLAFKEAIEAKLVGARLSYEFEDLDYPAVSIDVGNGHLGTLVGAYAGSGDAYEFGESVKSGVLELARLINDGACKDTKYVIGGYSQGAMVVMNSLSKVRPEKIVYAATFGDPKIYLPEGAGLVPAACGGRNLSEYRIYVPDCQAYKGILGAKNPYVESGYAGKVGTWCNKYDIMCSSHFNVESHTSYVEDGLYEDAARFIMSKIGAEFGIKNQYTSPHDTVIMIDSTGSMEGLIEKYKAEALRLADETLDSGGRVALYDYRDIGEGYMPMQRCNFETCNKESFRAGLDAIELDGGGDDEESLLSSSFNVMRQLKWKSGSTKSVVVLTDAGYHSPDLDGVDLMDVIRMSKQIDPVNFYIVTTRENVEMYRELAEETDGAVVSSVEELGVLTGAILERCDSLPRVEEEYDDGALPEVRVVSVEKVSEGAVKLSFESTGRAVVVILNDGIIGTIEGAEITITDLNSDTKNVVTLVPLSKTRRGEAVTVDLAEIDWYDDLQVAEWGDIVIPKAPNTGTR